ncbi:MAG: hypothetical protein KGI54_15145 [Pseudomonadota bacterium]|nr:hypothetical protein [Pseudomonadota bacterium]
MSTYKIVYQMGEHEMGGFSTVAAAVAESSSWGDDQIALTENIDGYADAIVNEETGETVIFLANKDAVLEKFGIKEGESFLSGIMNVGTYTQEEIAELK